MDCVLGKWIAGDWSSGSEKKPGAGEKIGRLGVAVRVLRITLRKEERKQENPRGPNTFGLRNPRIEVDTPRLCICPW